MHHLNKKTALHRQVLLAALVLAVLLPTVCCIVLTVRQSRMQRELASARAEILRLTQTAGQTPDQPGQAGQTSPGQPDPAGQTGQTPPETQSPGQTPPAAQTPGPAASGAPEYQALYPDLYSEHPVGEQSVTENVCYLTFDDGPSEQTPAILDILDRYQVKATFFIVGSKVQKYPDIVKDAVARGHTIGIHTNTHVYKDIYASVEAYLADFNAAYQHLFELTGVKAEVFRFPGGSINQYNKGIYQPIIAEMLRRGFAYYDWNASAEDAVGKPTAQSVVQNALSSKAKMPIVLMHDSTYTTATAEGLPKIIEGFQARGFSFGVITPDVYSVAFGYKD